jgi:aminomethyltransferase
LELAGRRPAREGCSILAEGTPIGYTTSGTYSPTLRKPIALGYVTPEYTKPGTQLTIDVRGRREPACIAELPFYRRKSKGKKK